MYKHLLIGTFSLRKNGQRTAINGMIEPLLSFFGSRTDTIDLVDGVHPGSDTVHAYLETFQRGKSTGVRTSIISRVLSPFLRASNVNGTQLWFKLRDFGAAIEYALRTRRTYELMIGLESIFTLAGILLRRVGRVETVVYYVSDYSPRRYTSAIFNWAYLALDRFCCYHADLIWDVSPAIMPARIASGLDHQRSAPVVLVPNALFPDQISAAEKGKQKPYSLVFAGTLGPENGPDLAIAALPKVLKTFPQTTLHVVGGGEPYGTNLRVQAERLGVAKQVVFHGFIADAVKLSQMVNTYAIGLAPYRGTPFSERYYGDATKIRLYLAAGLPVVTTTVPPIGAEVEHRGAGLRCGDTATSLANAITSIFEDTRRYENLRKNAIEYGKQNTWQQTYANAISRMRQYLRE